MRKIIIIAGIVTLFAIPVFSIGRQVWLLKQYCYNMANYRIINISSNDISFEIDLEIKNPSDLTVEVKSYDLKIYLNGMWVSDVKTNVNTPLYPRKFSTLSVPVKFNPSKTIDSKNIVAISNIITDFKNTLVRITGAVHISVDGINFTSKDINIESKLSAMLPTKNKLPSEACV